jgi:hypothetical protein
MFQVSFEMYLVSLFKDAAKKGFIRDYSGDFRKIFV